MMSELYFEKVAERERVVLGVWFVVDPMFNNWLIEMSL